MEQYVQKNQKKLRCGITTGTCAAAAAGAAALRLLTGEKAEHVVIRTPGGRTVRVPVYPAEEWDVEAAGAQGRSGRCAFYVVKDSGDDPDVTNGARIVAQVERIPGRRTGDGTPEPEMNCGLPEWETGGGIRQKENGLRISPDAFQSGEYPYLYLDGREGVGRVTCAGLEQRPGQAAINAVPRSMIFQVVAEACEQADDFSPLLITVSVPEGRELAKRTFNPQLGIEGGISILGTSGIVEPMSEKAIVDTIELQIRQLKTLGVKQLLVTPGNYGQGYAAEALGLNTGRSVKCSNYIGETLDLAISYEMEGLLLVGNIGKLVKLAAGIMNTHSRVADARREIFVTHTVLAGGTAQMAEALMQCVNTEEMLLLLEQWGLRVAVTERILAKIKEAVERRTTGKLDAGVILFSEHFGCLGQTEGTEHILPSFCKNEP